MRTAQHPAETRHYAPYGDPFDTTGTEQIAFGFTGEWTDANYLLYLRARYYAPGMGTFTALDPFEGTASRPMSLNGYLYVEGNTPNLTDPCGKFSQPSGGGLVLFGSSRNLAVSFNGGFCSSQFTNPQLQDSCQQCTDELMALGLFGVSLYSICQSQGRCPTTAIPPTPTGGTTFQVAPNQLAPGAIPYTGGCVEGSPDPEARRQCAIVAYNAALQRAGGSLTIDQVIALTIQGEGSAIYGQTANGSTVICRRGSQNVPCSDVTDLFERAVIRNLTRACNDSTTCTTQQFTQFIGEAQVWYNAGRSSGQADQADLNRLFGNNQYQNYTGVLSSWITTRSDVQSGCGSNACSWGNCKQDLRVNPPSEENIYWMYYQDQASDFYIREPQERPGEVIFIVGGYEPCNFE